jgi:hypothetical protein
VSDLAVGLPSGQSAGIPRPGMFASVRNRRGVIAGVEPFNGEDGRLHLVRIDYRDDQWPVEERLVWELGKRSPICSSLTRCSILLALSPCLRRTSMRFFAEHVGRARCPSSTLTALVLCPLERLPLRSPFHGAAEVEDYQLVPLLKALRMPRVNLPIADDDGIGQGMSRVGSLHRAFSARVPLRG